MLRIEDMYLTDFGGTLMYRNTPLAYFKIENKRLVEYRRLKDTPGLFPMEFAEIGGAPVTYAGINSFFRERVVLDGSQGCQSYLASLGLKQYDFNAIVNIMHGGNNVDNWWVSTQDYHPTWEDIQEANKQSWAMRVVEVPLPTTWSKQQLG